MNRLDALDAEQPCTVTPLWQAARLASTLATFLAQTPKVAPRPQQVGASRTQAPLQPRRLALQRAVSCQAMAQAFERTGTEATRRWDTIAELLTISGKAPNWRRQPAVLDQLWGWKRPPRARKQAISRDISPRNIKETA